jgi:hypothetical protein
MKKILPVLILSFLILPTIALANVCDQIQSSPNAAKLCDTILEVGVIMAIAGGALAIVFIIIGGIKYVTVGDNEDQTKSARKMITNALIGIAIILMAEFLINLVAEFISQRFL